MVEPPDFLHALASASTPSSRWGSRCCWRLSSVTSTYLLDESCTCARRWRCRICHTSRTTSPAAALCPRSATTFFPSVRYTHISTVPGFPYLGSELAGSPCDFALLSLSLAEYPSVSLIYVIAAVTVLAHSPLPIRLTRPSETLTYRSCRTTCPICATRPRPLAGSGLTLFRSGLLPHSLLLYPFGSRAGRLLALAHYVAYYFFQPSPPPLITLTIGATLFPILTAQCGFLYHLGSASIIARASCRSARSISFSMSALQVGLRLPMISSRPVSLTLTLALRVRNNEICSFA